MGDSPVPGSSPLFDYCVAAHGLQGLQAFFAAHGLQGLQGLQAFAAHGLQGLQALAAHGLQGLQAFAAHGLQGLQAFAAQGLHGLHGLQAATTSFAASTALSLVVLSQPASARLVAVRPAAIERYKGFRRLIFFGS